MTEGTIGSVRVSENNGCGTLFVSGSFAFHLQNEFRNAYEKLVEKNSLVRVDLHEVDYMDSSGLGMLLVMKKFLDGARLDYEIVRSQGQTFDLLAMTHFNQYFRINGEQVRPATAS